VPRYWIAFIRHEPLPGEWSTAELAMAAAEAPYGEEVGRGST
jgi:hypothetical protein